jgi:predicted ABC-type transport system involved in lysophospholipase L1 biosynthesis ATPase subunit
VAIARALANEPDVLLADEPTGNRDSATGQEIIDLVARLSRERGLSVILVTHDPAAAASAHRLVRIRDGQIVDGRGGRDRALSAAALSGRR